MKSEALEKYKIYLDRQPISAHTKRNYLQRVKCFLQWLDGAPDGELALTDPAARDVQLRDFKTYMLQRHVSPSTINGILSAVDNFSMSRGMETGRVKRLELPSCTQRLLHPEEEKRLRKILIRCSLRNRILVMLFWHCGLRISEASALNVGDLSLSMSVGQIRVSSSRGTKRRIVPIDFELNQILQQYLSKQGLLLEHHPLFLSQKRCRLSVASIDRIVRQIGLTAGVILSAQRLRQDFVSRLIRSGINIVMVAELCGHARLETVRRYSPPTEAEPTHALAKEFSCNHETRMVDVQE